MCSTTWRDIDPVAGERARHVSDGIVRTAIDDKMRGGERGLPIASSPVRAAAAALGIPPEHSDIGSERSQGACEREPDAPAPHHYTIQTSLD